MNQLTQNQEPGHAGSRIGEMVRAQIIMVVETTDRVGVYRRVIIYTLASAIFHPSQEKKEENLTLNSECT